MGQRFGPLFVTVSDLKPVNCVRTNILFKVEKYFTSLKKVSFFNEELVACLQNKVGQLKFDPKPKIKIYKFSRKFSTSNVGQESTMYTLRMTWEWGCSLIERWRLKYGAECELASRTRRV